MDDENHTKYLSDSEKNVLNKVNKLSNKLSDKNIKNKNIFNKTIHEVVQRWSKVHQNIINELIDLFTNMDSYDEYNYWWEYIIKYFKKTLEIFLKEDNMIYSGITLIFISVVIYFVDITD